MRELLVQTTYHIFKLITVTERILLASGPALTAHPKLPWEVEAQYVGCGP